MASDRRPPFRVVVHPEAHEQILAVYEFIASRNLAAAGRLIERIREVIESLAAAPRLGARIPEFMQAGVERRHRIVGPYRVIYDIEGDMVYLLMIRHGKRRRLSKRDFRS